ncbi:ATP-grasp domain-containing protein [Acetoanaerobium noterae]|uniref:ATP-grasp domain-containing protein n=1 Tax=Acetoanaerobium noterae TaxID=745369 RepID=UPI003242BF02
MKIMLTSAGKRVQLIKHLRLDNIIVGVDCSEMVAGKFFLDIFYKVPSFESSDYIKRIIEIIKIEKIDMLIPLHEGEFEILCNYRKEILDSGAILLLSDDKVLQVFEDKLKSYEFFVQHDISTPKTYCSKTLVNNQIEYPVIIKPKKGMGSKGVAKITTKEELDFFIKHQEDSIIQEFISGTEYTIDVLCDLEGDIITVVPRERLEIRDGEVSKSKTIKHPKIIKAVIEMAQKINETLGAMRGPMTFQCIVENSEDIKFIEVNPRFGGGVPLTFEAGINYSLILNMIKNNELVPEHMREFDEITMIRFDDAIFCR